MRLGDLDALREAIQDICKTYTEMSANQLGYDILKIINNTPTVIVDNCGKCPYYKDIDRDIITEAYNDGYKTAKEDFENHKLVNSSQRISQRISQRKNERTQGEWIHYLGCGVGKAVCSECGQLGEIKKYCGNCGADMRGEEE